jgi:hypothetical protein
MTDIEIFALIVLPAMVIGGTYIAVLLHKRALARLQRANPVHAKEGTGHASG